jgi:hypothetical protein
LAWISVYVGGFGCGKLSLCDVVKIERLFSSKKMEGGLEGVGNRMIPVIGFTKYAKYQKVLHYMFFFLSFEKTDTSLPATF